MILLSLQCFPNRIPVQFATLFPGAWSCSCSCYCSAYIGMIVLHVFVLHCLHCKGSQAHFHAVQLVSHANFLRVHIVGDPSSA